MAARSSAYWRNMCIPKGMSRTTGFRPEGGAERRRLGPYWVPGDVGTLTAKHPAGAIAVA
eukprot:5446735-Prymnesium_polylepis.1